MSDAQPAATSSAAEPPAAGGPYAESQVEDLAKTTQAPPEQVAYSRFLEAAKAGEIERVLIEGTVLRGEIDGQRIVAVAPEGSDDAHRLIDSGADVIARQPESGGMFSGFLSRWGPVLLIIGVMIFLYRRQQAKAGGTAAHGKSQAKLMSEEDYKVTFKDVAGAESAKEDVEEVISALRDPERFKKVGGEVPRGILLAGPPGTGKTLLARAVAGESGVPFYSVGGSAFVDMYVGVGASRVRDLFAEARKKAAKTGAKGAILFIDEIDALGKSRVAGGGGGSDERDQTLNQLLSEMDGVTRSQNLIVIAATNRPDILDPALTRPGRFDRQIQVDLPSVTERQQILKVHAKTVPLADDVDLAAQSRLTPGYSGAELRNVVNEAALFAARDNRDQVSAHHFELARDKVMVGAERRSMIMTQHEKRLVAYHEAGHALVGLKVPGNDPLHKITIVPRGRAMGVAMWMPEGDRKGYTVREAKARIAMAFGGRVAERLVFGDEEVTSGAAADIRMATSIARRMVTEWGMSEVVGPIDCTEGERDRFLGRAPKVSAACAGEVEAEVKRFVQEGQDTATQILTRGFYQLEALADALLARETLTAQEIDEVLMGECAQERMSA